MFDTTSCLQIKNLRCSRGDRDLFANLDFELNAGKMLQIKGQNGSGKTSLLRILAGISNPEDGTIKWKNKETDDCDEFEQDFIYFGHQIGIKAELSALENLEFSRQLKNTNQADVWQILKNLSLNGFEDIPCHNLSAGQKRRVSLARLFVSDCQLWILDEPFTALDISGIEFLENYCLQHLDQGGMILLTTHQPLKILSDKNRILDLDTYAT